MSFNLPEAIRQSRSASYQRSSIQMRHQAALRKYAENRIAELAIMSAAAKRAYDECEPLQQRFPMFNYFYNEYRNAVRLFWDSFKNRFFGRNVKEFRSKLISKIETDLQSKVEALIKRVVEADEVSESVRIGLLRRVCKCKFDGIHEKYVSIHVPVEFVEATNGEKEYYEHLKRVFTEEIAEILASANDEYSIASLQTTIAEHAEKLSKLVTTIQKLAAGEDVEDSFVLSDDDSVEDDDDEVDDSVESSDEEVVDLVESSDN